MPIDRKLQPPPLIAVVAAITGGGLGADHRADIARRDQLLALPAPLGEHQLAQPGEVPAAVARPAAAHADAFRGAVPSARRDPQRSFQRLRGVVGQGLLRGLFQHRAEHEGIGRAVGMRATVRAVFRSRHPRCETLDRQRQREVHPVLGHVHALFIAGRERILVIALPQRAHGEQVFHRHRAQPGIDGMASGERGEVVVHTGLYAGQGTVADGGADQHRGDTLAGRAHVVEGVRRAAVEVALVRHLAVHQQQHAGDLFNVLAGDRRLQCGDPGCVQLGGPGQCGRWQDNRQGEDQRGGKTGATGVHGQGSSR